MAIIRSVLALELQRIRFLKALRGLTLLLLLSACTQAEDEGDTSPSNYCIPEQRRLTEECREGGYLIEECIQNKWSDTDDCAEPSSECESADPTSEVLDGYCGDFAFNRRVMECRGRLYQKSCACGAVDPQNTGTVSHTDTEGNVAGLEGIVFPRQLELGSSGYVTDLDHVLCVDRLRTSGSPIDLPGLIGAKQLSASRSEPDVGDSSFKTSMDLSSLRTLEYLRVDGWPERDFRALSTLEALNDLEVACSRDTRKACPEIEGLEGLENIEKLATVFIDAPHLANFEGLSGLTQVEYYLRISYRDGYELSGLKGLESLRTVGDVLEIPVQNEEDFRVLLNLETVGSDLIINLIDPQLACSIPGLLSHVEVRGEVLLGEDPFDPSTCD